MSKIIKYILSILKDFIVGLLQTVFILLFGGIIAFTLLVISSILPIIVANLTESIFLFILTYVVEFILLDLLLDGQSDTIDYFKNKWRKMQ